MGVVSVFKKVRKKINLRPCNKFQNWWPRQFGRVKKSLKKVFCLMVTIGPILNVVKQLKLTKNVAFLGLSMN